MKILIILLFSLAAAYAQSPSDFLQMSDAKKIEFLENKALLVENQSQLDSYIKGNPLLRKDLIKIGNELSNIWGDTVLEGPYVQTTTHETILSGIYLFQGQVFAYSASASADGVFIEDDGCEYDEANNQWNDNCSGIRIYENFYMDFTGNFIESDNYAEVDS